MVSTAAERRDKGDEVTIFFYTKIWSTNNHVAASASAWSEVRHGGELNDERSCAKLCKLSSSPQGNYVFGVRRAPKHQGTNKSRALPSSEKEMP